MPQGYPAVCMGAGSDCVTRQIENPSTVRIGRCDGDDVVIERISEAFAEEDVSSGTVWTASTDLELPYDSGITVIGVSDGDDQTAALRFPNLPIPTGSLIQSAAIQFQCDEISYGTLQLRVTAEGRTFPFSFGENPFNISMRDTTVSSVIWEPLDWDNAGDIGAPQRTIDLKQIVQEVVSMPSWDASAPIVFLITRAGPRNNATSTRVAESGVDWGSSKPSLQISYKPGLVYRQELMVEQFAEERLVDGSTSCASNDLELSNDSGWAPESGEQVVAMRFAGVKLPEATTIHFAYIQFTANERGDAPVTLRIGIERTTEPARFCVPTTQPISRRSRTSVEQLWSPGPWWYYGESGVRQRTPDLSTLLQSLPRSITGAQDIVFLIDRANITTTTTGNSTGANTGTRSATTQDSWAPRLVMFYSYNDLTRSSFSSSPSPSVQTASPTHSPSETSSVSASASSSPSPAPKKEHSKPKSAAVAIGVTLTLVAFVIAGLFCCIRYRRRNAFSLRSTVVAKEID
eukprot:c8068_g1_i1.p1 GENE.c8068_g1_i1~~c8068_g1_i1.p1  ORF type:complete len:517 (+),score=129.82 c8068_g1_i1:1091-2641(+)